jgi:predicted GNAT family acetyltransferase
VNKSRRIRRSTYRREVGSYKVSVGKIEVKAHLEGQGVDGGIIIKAVETA